MVPLSSARETLRAFTRQFESDRSAATTPAYAPTDDDPDRVGAPLQDVAFVTETDDARTLTIEFRFRESRHDSQVDDVSLRHGS